MRIDRPRSKGQGRFDARHPFAIMIDGKSPPARMRQPSSPIRRRLAHLLPLRGRGHQSSFHQVAWSRTPVIPCAKRTSGKEALPHYAWIRNQTSAPADRSSSTSSPFRASSTCSACRAILSRPLDALIRFFRRITICRQETGAALAAEGDRAPDRPPRRRLRDARPRRDQCRACDPHRRTRFDAAHSLRRPDPNVPCARRPSRKWTSRPSSVRPPNGCEIDDPARIPELVSRAFHVAMQVARPGRDLAAGRHADRSRRSCRRRARRTCADVARPHADGGTAEAAGRPKKPIAILGGSGWSARRSIFVRAFRRTVRPSGRNPFRRAMLFPNGHNFAANSGIGPNPKLLARVKGGRSRAADRRTHG